MKGVDVSEDAHEEAQRPRRVAGFEQVEKGSLIRAGAYHRWIKIGKRRHERRKARIDPEVVPGYGKYCGYEV